MPVIVQYCNKEYFDQISTFY